MFNLKPEINISSGWLIGFFSAIATAMVGSVKLVLWNHTKNGKHVSKEICEKNRDVFEEKFTTLFNKATDHSEMLKEVRSDIKVLLQK